MSHSAAGSGWPPAAIMSAQSASGAKEMHFQEKFTTQKF